MLLDDTSNELPQLEKLVLIRALLRCHAPARREAGAHKPRKRD